MYKKNLKASNKYLSAKILNLWTWNTAYISPRNGSKDLHDYLIYWNGKVQILFENFWQVLQGFLRCSNEK